MIENRVKRALKEGKTVIGTMVTELRVPEVARIIKAAGFDFMFIDTEHSSIGYETLAEIVRMGRGIELSSIVRVTDDEYHLIARVLDIGAQGIMVPRVESPERVRRVVSYVKFPPLGVRGFGSSATQTDYKKVSIKELVKILNQETMIVTQIERKQAIEHIEEIVSIEGVDAALIGPNDLSISLGVPGETTSLVVRNAIQKVVDACKKYGKVSGIHTRNLQELLYWRDKGMRLLVYSTDTGLLIEAAKSVLAKLRA
jgi:2-keto-3-deoxy-L-rhamnonate aldolase RhmA